MPRYNELYELKLENNRLKTEIKKLKEELETAKELINNTHDINLELIKKLELYEKEQNNER